MRTNSELEEDVEALVDKHYATLYPKKKWKKGDYIPVAFSKMDKDEIRNLIHTSIGLNIVDGAISKAFEKEMARFVGVRHAVFCNSGSSANLLAVMSLTSSKLGSRALKPGDEIITSAVGFPTTVAPIIQAGCVPVFVDVSLLTYNPTPHAISDAITEKTKAIFIAHTLGNPFDVQAIKDIAEQNDLWLIEDCCDAIGGSFNDKNLGTYGHISTTSFYPAHHLTTGEGGMVFTDNPLLNTIIRSFRDWGRDCWCAPNVDNTCGKRFGWSNKGELPVGYDHKYIYSHIGYNLKSTDLNASIGLAQMKKLPSFIKQRRENWSYMRDKMESVGLSSHFILPSAYPRSNPSWFGYVLTIKEDTKFTKGELVTFLERKGIGTRNIFRGNITKQPAFIGKGRVADHLHKADIVMNNTFWVGIHPGITNKMIDYVVESLQEFIGRAHE